MRSAPTAGSAAFLFLFPGTHVVWRIWANGDPEHVRKAFRKACSHRRSLVVLRPSVYLVNCIAALGSVIGRDNGEWLGEDTAGWDEHAAPCNWRYVLEMRGKVPYVIYHSRGKDPTARRLFEFLGTEHRREWKLTRARRKNRGGRPSGLRKEHPELFVNVKAKAPNGKTLGLKHKRRGNTIRVDFTGTPLFDKHDPDLAALDPDYERELDRIYDRREQP